MPVMKNRLLEPRCKQKTSAMSRPAGSSLLSGPLPGTPSAWHAFPDTQKALHKGQLHRDLSHTEPLSCLARHTVNLTRPVSGVPLNEMRSKIVTYREQLTALLEMSPLYSILERELLHTNESYHLRGDTTPPVRGEQRQREAKAVRANTLKPRLPLQQLPHGGRNTRSPTATPQDFLPYILQLSVAATTCPWSRVWGTIVTHITTASRTVHFKTGIFGEKLVLTNRTAGQEMPLR